jgi:hypothetical protein
MKLLTLSGILVPKSTAAGFEVIVVVKILFQL